MAARALSGIKIVEPPEERRKQLLQLRRSSRDVLPKGSLVLAEIDRALATLPKKRITSFLQF